MKWSKILQLQGLHKAYQFYYVSIFGISQTKYSARRLSGRMTLPAFFKCHKGINALERLGEEEGQIFRNCMQQIAGWRVCLGGSHLLLPLPHSLNVTRALGRGVAKVHAHWRKGWTLKRGDMKMVLMPGGDRSCLVDFTGFYFVHPSCLNHYNALIS